MTAKPTYKVGKYKPKTNIFKEPVYERYLQAVLFLISADMVTIIRSSIETK